MQHIKLKVHEANIFKKSLHFVSFMIKYIRFELRSFRVHEKRLHEWRITMAKSCYVTGKKNLVGNRRSFALNATKRKQKANLQKVRIEENGEKKTVYVSARALKKSNLKRV